MPLAKSRPLWPVLGLLWATLFTGLFLLRDVGGGAELLRLDLFIDAPTLLLGWIPGFGEDVGSVAALADRWDLILVGSVIVAGSLAWGRLLLRGLGFLTELDRWDRWMFAGGLGLSVWSLITLGVGLSGGLNCGLFLALLIAPLALEIGQTFRTRDRTGSVTGPAPSRRLFVIGSLAAFPFLLLIGVGAMLPPIDFDVRAYHLVGPKEWFLAGEIRWLPHNVYTSFPFLTEMLTLSAMTIREDPFRGAIAGKVVLSAFSVLIALGSGSVAMRIWSGLQPGAQPSSERKPHRSADHQRRPWAVGLLAAVVVLSVPWTHRIAVTALAEGGLSAYLILTVAAVLLSMERGDHADRWRYHLLTGLLAGSAFACKYPAVLSVVVPIGVWIVFVEVLRVRGGSEPARSLFKIAAKAAGGYSVGVLLTAGPWLLKNLIETGNPVYPLLFGLFGGADWNSALDARWQAAHSPEGYAISDLMSQLHTFAIGSIGQSPLLFALAPPSLLFGLRSFPDSESNRRPLGLVLCWGFVIWGMASWWLLTHRIERFWVPLLPVLASLAAIGIAGLWQCSDRREWRFGVGAVVGCGLLYGFLIATTPLAGFNGFFLSSEAAHAIASRSAPSVTTLNQRLPTDARVLAVGEAQIFDARFDVIYNSVFDRDEFLHRIGETEPLNSAAVRDRLRADGVTHILVNWSEILRYRATYGFSERIRPSLFRDLVDQKVLGEPERFSLVPVDALDDSRRAIVQNWDPDFLIESRDEIGFFPGGELYPVR